MADHKTTTEKALGFLRRKSHLQTKSGSDQPPLSSRLITNTLRAANAAQRGDWELTAALWRTIIGDAGRHAPEQAFLKLSEALRRGENYVDATSAVLDGLKRFPESFALAVERAEVASAWQDWPVAIDSWETVVRNADNKTPEIAYVRLSTAYAKSGDLAKADEVVKRGLKAYPTSSSIAVAHARNASEVKDDALAAKRWHDVLSNYMSVLEPKIIASAVSALRQAGQLKQADAVIDQAVTQHGHRLVLAIEQAENVTARKDWNQALALWEKIAADFAGSSEFSVSASLLCRFNISVISRIVRAAAYKKSIDAYRQQKTTPRVAIVTSYTKGYDTLTPPAVLDPAFDYIAYTDDDQAQDYGIYQIRPLPDEKLDGARLVRYIKSHPHEVGDNYDVVLWIDTNIMIADDLQPFINKFKKSGLPIASAVHPLRSSLYDEYKACLNRRKGDPATLEKQIDHYRAEGYESHEHAENGVLMFRPHDERVPKAMEEWWRQICEFSTRDQLSFIYSLDKHHVPWYKHTTPPMNVRTNPLFVLVQHYTEKAVLKELSKCLKK